MGVVLFENKSDCCACGACLNVCSKSAISMKPDAEGFLYPEIDPNKCVECGVCKRVCKYKTSDLNAVESTYAVTNRDEKQIMKAAFRWLVLSSGFSYLVGWWVCVWCDINI